MNRLNKFFKLKRNYLIVVALLGISVIACEKYTIEGPEKMENVSFATNIVPIFTKNCISCHTTGKTAPNFEAEFAFASITTRKLVNLTTPESSKLYDKLISSTFHQPFANATEELTILTWIEEGAKNN